MGSSSSKKARTPVEHKDNLKSVQTVRILDLLGEGPISGFGNGEILKSVYLDDTPVISSSGTVNFKGVKVSYLVGEEGQTYLPSFDTTENTVAVSTEVKSGNPVVRTVDDSQVDRVLIQLRTGALVNVNTQTGDRDGTIVDMRVEILKDGNVEQGQDVRIEGKTSDQYFRDVEFGGLPATPFQIRVSRVSPEYGSDRQDDTFFASYVEIIDAKLSYPHTALVGIEFDSELFGASIPTRNYLVKGLQIRIPSNYDPISRTYTGFWDGTFKVGHTDNPAWVFYDLMTSKRYGLGRKISTDQVDKWALYSVAQYCDQMVDDGFGGTEPRFSFNANITTQRQAYEVMQDLVSCFRGLYMWDGQVATVVLDRPSDPVAIYTNSNVVDGEFSYQSSALNTVYTAVHIQYVDRNDAYRTKTEYVSDDAAIKRYGLNVRKVTSFGCTSRSQAIRTGKWLLETSKLERQSVSFEVGREGLKHLPYDIIQVADNDYTGVDVAGKILSVNGDVVSVDIDISGVISSTLSYIGSNGKVKQVEILEKLGTHTLKLAEIVTFSVGSTFFMRPSNLGVRIFRAVSISENSDDGTYSITAVEHIPEKEAIVDNRAVFDPLDTTVYTRLPQVTGLNSVNGTEGLTFVWGTNGDTQGLTYQAKLYRDGTLIDVFNDLPTPEITLNDLKPGQYRLEIRARNRLGQFSEPQIREFVIDYGLYGLRTSPELFGVKVEWDLPRTSNKGLFVEVVAGQSPEFSLAQNVGLFSYPTTTTTITGLGLSDILYVWARIGDSSGVKGEWAGHVEGRPSQDPSKILDYVEGQITESQLHQDLMEQFQSDAASAAVEAVRESQGEIISEQLALSNRINQEVAEREALALDTAGKFQQVVNEQVQMSQELVELGQAAVDNAQLIAQNHLDMLDKTSKVSEALMDEVSARTLAISAEAEARQESLQTLGDKLSGDLLNTAQTLGTDIANLTTIVDGQASTLSTLTASVDDFQAALQTEKIARIEADNSEASSRETLATQVGDNTVAINNTVQAVSDLSSSTATRFETMSTTVEDNHSEFTQFQETQSTLNSSQTQTITGLTSRIEDAESSITDVKNTYAKTDEVGATAVSAITAVWGDIPSLTDQLQSSVSSLSQTVANSESTNATQFQNLTSSVQAAESALNSFKSTQASLDEAQTIEIETAKSRIEEAESSITSINQTLTTHSEAITTLGTSVNAAVSKATADLNDYKQAQASVDTAQTTEINNAKSRIGAAESSISSIQTTYAKKDEVGATAVSAITAAWGDVPTQTGQLQSSLNTLSQTVSNNQQTAASNYSSLSSSVTTLQNNQKITYIQSQALFDIRTPKWYVDTHGVTRVEEFVSTTYMGLTGTSFASLSTSVAFATNLQSGHVKQTATVPGGKTYLRSSTGDTSWSAWVEQESTAGALAKAEAAKNAAIAAADASLTTFKTTQAALDTAQTTEINNAKSRIGAAESSISSIQTTYAKKDEVGATAVSAITAAWGDVPTQTGQLQSSLNTLSQTVSNNQQTSASNYASLASSVTTLQNNQKITAISSQELFNIRTPKWYLDTYGLISVEELVRSSYIDPNLTSGYAHLTTNIGLSRDLQYGYIKQSATVPGGKTYLRSSTGDTSWSAWVEQESTAGALAKAEAAKNAAIAAADASLTTFKNTQAAVDTAQTTEINNAKSRIGAAESSITTLSNTVSTQQASMASLSTRVTATFESINDANGLIPDYGMTNPSMWVHISPNTDISPNFTTIASSPVQKTAYIHRTGSGWIYSKAKTFVGENRKFKISAYVFKHADADGMFLWTANKVNLGTYTYFGMTLGSVGWNYVETTLTSSQLGDTSVQFGFAVNHSGTNGYGIITGFQVEDVTDLSTLNADLLSFKQAQASVDTAQTTEINNAKSRIGAAESSISSIQTTYAKEDEVGATAVSAITAAWGDVPTQTGQLQSSLNTLSQTVSNNQQTAASNYSSLSSSVTTLQNNQKITYIQSQALFDIRTPKWYVDTHGVTKVEESVSTTYIGLTGTSFASLSTSVAFATNLQFGHIKQTATLVSGKVFTRASSGETTWSTWVEQETASGAQDKADAAKNAAIAAAAAELSSYQSTQATKDTAQTTSINGAISRIATAESSISSLNTTLANQNTAISSVNTTLTARLNSSTSSTSLTADSNMTNPDAWESHYPAENGTAAFIAKFRTNLPSSPTNPTCFLHTTGANWVYSRNRVNIQTGRKYRFSAYVYKTTTADAPFMFVWRRVGSLNNYGYNVMPTFAAGGWRYVELVLTAEQLGDNLIQPGFSLNQNGTDGYGIITLFKFEDVTFEDKVQSLYTIKTEAFGTRKAIAGLTIGADGNTGDAEVVILGNKFMIADPNTGTVRPMLTLSNVNGTNMLTLRGDFVADGTILGRHIAASQTLTSPVINGGSLNIGSGKFTVSSAGAVSIRANATSNVGLQINNNSIKVYDASGNLRVTLGYLL